ncbi:unnamed protein product [Ixodes pacificus]
MPGTPCIEPAVADDGGKSGEWARASAQTALPSFTRPNQTGLRCAVRGTRKYFMTSYSKWPIKMGVMSRTTPNGNQNGGVLERVFHFAGRCGKEKKRKRATLCRQREGAGEKHLL